MIRKALEGAALALALTTPALFLDANDYPTAARVDYVIGCMGANGETRGDDPLLLLGGHARLHPALRPLRPGGDHPLHAPGGRAGGRRVPSEDV